MRDFPIGLPTSGSSDNATSASQSPGAAWDRRCTAGSQGSTARMGRKAENDSREKRTEGGGSAISDRRSERAANFISYTSSFRLLSSPPILLVDLHLITVIMRLPIVGLLSLAVAGLVAGSSLYQDVTHIVERQANASSLNATLLQIFEDIDEAKTCNDCEACYTPQITHIFMFTSTRTS